MNVIIILTMITIIILNKKSQMIMIYLFIPVVNNSLLRIH